jgi:hypothetical protein
LQKVLQRFRQDRIAYICDNYIIHRDLLALW